MAGSSVSGSLRRLVADGLFEEADSEGGVPWLLGSQCTRCAEIVFPRMSDCPNCLSHDTMQPYRLRGHGTLKDFVVAHRGPKGFQLPYIQAYVRLDDGPVVYSNLDGVEPDEQKVQVGTEVEMRIAVVKTVDDVDFVGWTFHPVAPRNE